MITPTGQVIQKLRILRAKPGSPLILERKNLIVQKAPYPQIKSEG